MAIQIKSFNQILGDMLRKIVADTSLNDINAGSVLLTLLEAAASNDFENNTAILNVLELLNIDAIKNNDLDAKAGDFGLERRPAIKASGYVNILNTNITKRSSGLYVIKPAPISGQTKIYINNATGWSNTGSLYIGRGTGNFEGPIAYTNITVFPTYAEVTLSSALQKDHLISDTVIDSQGEPDRIITAGAVVKIPANNQNPEIQYVTLRDAIIPSGEDVVKNIAIVALVAGSIANAGINTITTFDTPPFSGAGVTNTSAFSSGKDIETDVELRNRLKSYSVTLARGTAPSIIAAIQGVSDPDDNNQVASAVITEPVKNNAPSILYIDDGKGFEPSYAGQTVDKLLANADGTEEFLQLANFPVPRPQVVNIAETPYALVDGSFLRVAIDGEEETIFFSASQFVNISAATISEVVAAINTNSILFKARFTDDSSQILIYPVAYDAEIIQVATSRETENPALYANSSLKFPTDEFSYIALYQNSMRLREKQKNAQISTTFFSQWNVVTPSNLIISVDGTPAQDRNFALSDFVGASSFTSLTLADWVAAFNEKFAGLTAEPTSSQTMKITSNKEGNESSILVVGGTLLNKWFPNLPTESVGQASQFELNRQTGNLRILTDVEPGDSISAGVEDAKGFNISTETVSGNYNFSNDLSGRPANMVLVVDSTFTNQKSIPLSIGATIDITNPSGTVMRIMSSTAIAFSALQPANFIYITPRTSGWVSLANTGLFKIIAKGNHITAGVDTFIDVENIGVVAEAGITIADTVDIKGFETDGFPQIWRGSYLINPPSESITDVAISLNRDVAGVQASIYRSNSIKLTSTTERNGSIAIPISIGNAFSIFGETESAQFGNPPHVATRISDKTLTSMFKRTAATNANVWLNRHTYTDIKGGLTANSIPDAAPFSGIYSEQVQSTGTLTNANVSYDDYLSFTRGNNRNQFRTIKARIAGDEVGTQQSVARTELDHITADEFELVRPVSLSSDDSIVFVLDQDPTVKTIDIKMSRTGRINSGSGGNAFLPTTTEFSADDQDNEPGVDFGDLTVWGTIANNTDFSDYAVWMRARNWYATGGVANSTPGDSGKMLVRAAQFGPNGESLRFNIQYPGAGDQTPTTSFENTPSFGTYTYYFGSGAVRGIALSIADTITVAANTGDYFDYTFSAGNFATVQVGDILTINNLTGVSAPNQGTFAITAKSGMTLTVINANAIPNGAEAVSNVNGINIYPLAGNDVATIVSTVNAEQILELVAVGDPAEKINKSTDEDYYTYGGNSTALAFGHNPTIPADRDHINLYDGIAWVKSFKNTNPNFTMKNDTGIAFVLNNVAPTIYQMDTAPNSDIPELGEQIKLIPVTIKNIQHQLTQKALSQLPIVANIKIADDRKNVQITSKNLGSDGAIEVVGGNANKSQAYIDGESEVSSDVNGSTLLVKVPAFPDTFNVGDIMKLQNDAGSKRLSRLISSDTLTLTAPSGNTIQYNYNAKATAITSATQFTITDISASYGRPAGYVWRWTHDGTATLVHVREGDQVFAYGANSAWKQGNKARMTGDGNAAGLTVIAVNDAGNYFDIVNPNGSAMATTAVGGNLIVQICPTPLIRWNLPHAARVAINSIVRSSNVATVTTIESHMMNTGDTANVSDSNNIADGNYTITVTSGTTFSFASVGANFTEGMVNASTINNATTPTRYRVEKLGFSDMVRISRQDGALSGFIDSGVAVDDYVVVSGDTFRANNNGRFRVLAVDNNSIIIENPSAADELNTVVRFNNKSLEATWTANTNSVSGLAGTFKNLSIGDWVKKEEDNDKLYQQITGFVGGTADVATSITLGGNYGGSSAIAPGVGFDELNDYDKGVTLKNMNDLAFYEGDSTVIGDTLFVQNIINANWFSPNNVGSFEVTEVGTDSTTYKPFIKISNDGGTAEANRLMSINTAGFYIIESLANRFYSYRQISRSALDDTRDDLRAIYMTPDNRAYKFTEANTTSIIHTGKMGYNTDVTVGVDGYLYYTGLLRRVQRIVDGYEPDATNFPGRRAVGGFIETLPPLIRKININIDVTTNEGINIGDISNNIKSVIINYIDTLGVGQDVILSEIIAATMQIKGVAAVTFTSPVPSTERITIANNEKAVIAVDSIGIA